MWYKKIGGLHWLAIGRLRLAWCVKSAPKVKASKYTLILDGQPV